MATNKSDRFKVFFVDDVAAERHRIRKALEDETSGIELQVAKSVAEITLILVTDSVC